MSRRDKQPDQTVVKCACGLIMRAYKWKDHWYTCKYGGTVPLLPGDEQELLDWERLKEAEQHACSADSKG